MTKRTISAGIVSIQTEKARRDDLADFFLRRLIIAQQADIWSFMFYNMNMTPIYK
jgi:hypothetical protein